MVLFDWSEVRFCSVDIVVRLEVDWFCELEFWLIRFAKNERSMSISPVWASW